jgi:hypothetical protein
MSPWQTRVLAYLGSHWKQLLTAAVTGYAVAHGMSADAAVTKANALLAILAGLLGG